ncbi:carbon-nitrogen hydrolase family protein [Streptomyces sp. VRA16 Mangrove soil]|uniref:carbon-nitrogen hydrolase family protein n=1 Tax=Streptomyces sp. VRA16 Mangrove soil TaxID=2817434 RepID=UPI001E28D672|nr:carbon-nitrogen hydrolase family protein [Streptomyces sp. VRA16 Mangrove soil]
MTFLSSAVRRRAGTAARRNTPDGRGHARSPASGRALVPGVRGRRRALRHRPRPVSHRDRPAVGPASRTWFPARALDNTCYAVPANHIGATGGWDACGSSAVWGPEGRPLAEAGPDRQELITADLDPRQLRAARDSEPMLRDLRDTTTHERARHRLG